MKKKLRSGLAVLALTMLGLSGARAQSPGGVAANLKIWLRPETFTPASWTDASGSGNDFTQSNASRQPFLTSPQELYNFNSQVDFGTTGNDARFMVVPTGRPYSANGSNSTLFTTSINRNVSGYSDIIGFGATTTGTGLINANAPVYTNLSSNVVLYPYTTNAGLPQVEVGKLYLNDVSFTVGTAGIKYGQNGQTSTVNNTFAAGNADHANGAVLGSQPEVRNGLIGEVVAYERDLTEAEKIRVRSYLAIKYGLTLPHNYVASNGSTVFWDQTANAGYNNNIAGIARDAGSLQNQKQSRSVNDGKQVLIATTGLADANAANTAELADGEFLLWGDNGLAKAPAVALSGAGINFRFAAIWKIQKTGAVGTVRVAWPAGLTNLKLIQSSDETIDSSDPATDMTATQVVNGVSYNYADVSLADGQFFTFAAFVQAPGGVAANLLMWHKANDGVNAAGAKNIWKDVSVNGRDITQNNNAAYQPSLVTDATFNADSKNYSFNFNPFYYFDGSSDFFYRDNDAYFPSPTSPGSTYGVTMKSASGGFRTEYGWGDDDPNLVVADNNYYVVRDNGTTINENVGLNTLSAHLAGMSWKGSGAANNGMYLNVNGKIYSSTNTNIGNINDANNFAIGSEGFGLTGNGNELYQGGISEVFAYSADHQNSGGDEKQRINSYLAIKYGITLSNDAGTGATNYLSSKSVVIWDATTNAGYNNNIAGIAKDDNSALHQKQSSSGNTGQQVIIGTNGLGNTNESNAASLTDGQFFVWGDNGLDKSPTVALNGIAGLNYRFASIWKVQNTNTVTGVRIAWPSGIPGLHLIQSADATFDGSDISTDMSANTITINGTTYNYADVTIGNGSYFTFGANLIGPGGVGGAVVWLKADSGTNTTTDGSAVSSWINIGSSGGAAGQLLSYDLPTFQNAVHNFNPAIVDQNINAQGSMVLTDVFPDNTQHPLSTFVLQSHPDVSSERTIVTYGTTANSSGALEAPWFLTSTTKLPRLFWQDNYVQTAPITGVTRINDIPAISSYYMPQWVSNPHTATLSLNGATGTISGNVNASRPLGSHLYINGDGGSNNLSGGITSEIISYGRDLTATEIQQVNSYLAIKYGITLLANDALAATDYLNSAAAKVWDIATNVGYNNNIAGIARDDDGGLYQKQSNSVNEGQQLLIGTTGLAGTNASNAGTLGNGQFLIWGDNGQSKAPGTYNAGLGHGVNVLFKAIWKAQNTGNLGTVRVAWPAGLNNLSLVQSADETMDGSDAFTPMASNSQTINGVTYNYADVTLANGQYFTFATLVQNAPGGVFAGLSQWYRADINAANTGDATDVTTWTDVASGVVASQLATLAMPKFKTGAADYFNFNPGVNFTNGAQALGNLNVQTVASLNFDIYTLTKEGLAFGGGNSRVFSTLVDNVTTTGGIRHWDGIGLNTAGSLERVTQARVQTYFANPGNVDYSPTSPSIMYNSFTDTSVAKGLNGATGPTVTHSPNGQITGGYSIGTTQFSGNGSDNAGFIGNIGELIIYGAGNITAAERNKVESYLAVKYGVTLANTNNYITSAGDTVWYAASSASFYNNVAGLGRDNVSALHQKQSRSQHANTNNQVTIGLGQIAATNAANPGTIANGQFLIWGDNGQTQAMTNSSSSYLAFMYNGSSDNGRMTKRAWKVQNTAMGQEVLIRFPQASVGTTTFPEEGCSQFVLILADDAGFTTNQYVVALTQNGTDYEVRHTFPAGVSYFAFGKVNGWAPGVVQLPATVTAAPDFSTCASNSWYYAKPTAGTDKYLAIKGMTTAQLNNLDVLIDPAGAEFNGTIHTKLMPRVSTVTDAGAGTYTGVKVRVYFSQAEMDATIVSGAVKNGWFKFEGDAAAARADINADGLLNPAKAVELVPSSSGVEDGIKYVEFDNITSFSSFIYVSTTNETALPVTLVRFDGVKKGNSTLLSWDTSEESANKGFEIQRGGGNSSWQTIGFVGGQTEDGNSSVLLQYSFSDETPLAGKNYYRLKQLDWDGGYRYSRIVVVDFPSAATGLVLYPNPVSDGAITLDLQESGVLEVKIFNLSGIQVKAFKQSGRVLDVKGLSSGKYILRTVSGNGQVYEKTFIIP